MSNTPITDLYPKPATSSGLQTSEFSDIAQNGTCTVAGANKIIGVYEKGAGQILGSARNDITSTWGFAANFPHTRIYQSPAISSSVITSVEIGYGGNPAANHVAFVARHDGGNDFTIMQQVNFTVLSSGFQTVVLSTPLSISQGEYVGFSSSDFNGHYWSNSVTDTCFWSANSYLTGNAFVSTGNNCEYLFFRANTLSVWTLLTPNVEWDMADTSVEYPKNELATFPQGQVVRRLKSGTADMGVVYI